MDISHGTWPNFWDMLAPAMGGVHMIATTMPVSDDRVDGADMGAAFANGWVQQPNSSVGFAWIMAITQMPRMNGKYCGAADYSQGGGQGYNGCACNVVYNANINFNSSNWNTSVENWNDLQNDGYDVWGQGYATVYYWCNYSTTGYSFSNP
jgi:hypothetical protein